MSPALTISYALHPPSNTTLPSNISPTTTHTFPLDPHISAKLTRQESSGSASGHYEALRDAIARAKDVTGQEMTAWRDAVGSGEKDKDGREGRADEGEDDVEVEEE